MTAGRPNRRQFLSAAAIGIAAPIVLRGTMAMAAQPVTVNIRNGVLRGAQRSGALSFKGIPYAASTAGANRFKAPQPVVDWTGERDASQYGSLSPQINTGMSGEIFQWYNQHEPLGEDCCVLNVFTPDLKTDAMRPVIFYIHGGGYINGGGGGVGLDGSNLARYGDVVVVTINHRLNAFGYTNLSHLDPENFGDAANAGNLDIVAALEWVRDNITVFGGDPGSVTVFGQSGGGSKIMTLLAMPRAQGLFHKAISMSGAAGLNVDPAKDMEPYVNTLIKELGVDPKNLAAMQQIPFQAVLDARSRAVTASFEGARPVIDGKHIVTRPMTPEGLAMHANVPLLLGSTKTEASLFFQTDMRNFNLDEDKMRVRMRSAFTIDDAKIDAIMAAYRQDTPTMTASDILVAVASDVQFRRPLTAAAEMKSAAGQAPVYMYNFTWTIPWDDGVLGSPHAVDIPFAFGNANEAGEMTGRGDDAMETAMNMMSAFVNFARTGNPNNDRMPEWKPYDADTRVSMMINARCEAASDWRGEARRAIADLTIDPFNRAALYRYEF
ncbi:carboxylesterase/lipase family protein [Rhizobium leguminosarum]|uniref:carboxylesterase/lipase family protein n=1 Tax=Rhizobium leguminosarum TaxID=384 RepID=UPI003F9D3942